jgi:hypothetical protein
MATSKMTMVKKGGKSVPSFAADGVGKMKRGGTPKKMQMGGPAGGMPMQGAMPPARGPMPQGMPQGAPQGMPPAMKKGGSVGMHKMPGGKMMKDSDMGDKMGRAVKRKTADVKGRAMKKGA